MTRRPLAAALLSVALAGAGSFALATSAGAAPSAGSGRPLDTMLTGAAERPGPGDPDGSGTASLRVNPGTGEICYTLTVTGIDAPVAAHIHEAPAGEPGQVVVPLAAPVAGASTACVDVDPELARDIVRDPEAYYVNVHTAAYPGGAVRGQLG
jgi:hypothetical protein